MTRSTKAESLLAPIPLQSFWELLSVAVVRSFQGPGPVDRLGRWPAVALLTVRRHGVSDHGLGRMTLPRGPLVSHDRGRVQRTEGSPDDAVRLRRAGRHVGHQPAQDTENDCHPCALLEITASIKTPSVGMRREDGSDV